MSTEYQDEIEKNIETKYTEGLMTSFWIGLACGVILMLIIYGTIYFLTK